MSVLTLNGTGGYSVKQIIDSLTPNFRHPITSVGIEGEVIYFCTGSKLWSFDEKRVQIDSSSQTINIYNTSKGIVFYSTERGFYSTTGKIIKPISKPTKENLQELLNVIAIEDRLFAVTEDYPWFLSIDGKKPSLLNSITTNLKPKEKILKVSASGSYYFVSTASHSVLMFDTTGKLINRFVDFGNSYSSTPFDICTSDNINFFAITPTQILQFINPQLIQQFDSKTNLNGRVNGAIKFENKLYVVTSNGLYLFDDSGLGLTCNLLREGLFTDLVRYKNQLFAVGANGLFAVTGRSVEKTTPEPSTFKKVCAIKFDQPKAVLLNDEGVYIVSLNPPYSRNKIQGGNAERFINFFASDTILYLQSADQKWFTYDFTNNQSVAISAMPTLVNNQITTFGKTGVTIFLGKTFSGDPIYKTYSDQYNNYQAIVIEKKKTIGNTDNQKVLLALNNIFELNAAILDSDSSLILSTTQGLIKVSSNYIENNCTSPLLNIFSITSFDGDLRHVQHKGFLLEPSKLTVEYKINHGNSVEIILSGNSKFSWNKLKYAIRTKGLELGWSEWSTCPTFVITDLKPGNYTLIAKAQDLYGNESVELPINIKIVPNFLQTKFTLIALIILFILTLFTFYRWKNFSHALERFKLESIINRRTEELVKEKEKTDNLLARVLPRETATELKETGKVNTQKFNMATVLFSDIQGFTKITDELNPENLIDQLDKFFLYFDSVVEKYRIEKIKTIGDAYMCAGGIPHKNRTNPVEVVLAALEMMYFMREINLEHNPGQDIWDLRIGIDTGPVIAGVVGRSKLSYDIWGTTVNTASRMESSGEVGRINISGNTHMLVQEYFLCTYRGKMPIKNKGDIEMYFVEGIKPVLSTNLDCFRPNSDFVIQLQFLRFGDLEEFILEKLEKGLPQNLYYHNLKHTVDVYTQVVLIGRSENINQEELLLVQTAALLHDAGHLIDYDTHEEMGVKLAREILPDYLYSERQIQIISDLIMITKLPPKPRNLLEAIMCDADLDYLGRTDFIPVSNMLYKELHEHGRIGTIQEWNELQIKFIEKHQYFTNTARRLRNVNKNSQLENIKSWIEKNKL